MASADPRAAAPKRRTSVERNIWRRADGNFEVGYRDSGGKQRWRVPGFPSKFETITEARRARDAVLGAKAGGERVKPSPKLTFAAASDRWLAEQVCELRPATRTNYRNAVESHLKPRWGKRRMDSIDVTDAAKLVRELRAKGLSEWTISGVCRVAGRVFKFARRYCGWSGENPFAMLEAGERAKVSQTPERRIYVGGELAQTIAAAEEPWRTLFRLADMVGGRESELLGLWWEQLELDDLDAATIRFTHQADRQGGRVPLKTEESKATLPLPRSAAVMLLEHKARTPAPTSPRSFVFATHTGGALGQRNVLRALYRAQANARDADGRPTFPELFEHDDRGHLVVDEKGAFVARKVKRREIDLPNFHALRHGAAMDCDDAEEARDLLRHKDSNVTRAIYRAHFGDLRREALRARMEARVEAKLEAANAGKARVDATREIGEVVDLQAIATQR